MISRLAAARIARSDDTTRSPQRHQGRLAPELPHSLRSAPVETGGMPSRTRVR